MITRNKFSCIIVFAPALYKEILVRVKSKTFHELVL